MWMRYFLVVFLTVKSNVIHSFRLDKGRPMSAAIVSSVEEKLSSAFRELERLHRMFELLNEPENYHRVTRVIQIDKGDHYQVEMEYIPDTIKPKVYVSAYNRAPLKELNVQDYGTVTADFPKLKAHAPEDTIALVTFGFPMGIEFSLELDLSSYEFTHNLNNSTQTDVPNVLMSVSLPETEAVSSRVNKNLPRVDIILWTDVDVLPARWMGVRLGFWVASDEELKSFSSWEIPPVDLQNVHHDEPAGYRHWTAVIHSGKGQLYPEGKLVVYPEVNFHCPARCLVRSFHGSPRSVEILRANGRHGNTKLRMSQMLAWKSVLGETA